MLLTKEINNRKIHETSIHLSVMDWVKKQKSIKDFVFHIPNEGRRTIGYGRLLKKMGMRAGVSDLFIAIQKHGYGGAWIELKSENGILSPAQKNFIKDMKSQHYFTSVCYSIEEAISTIKWYCF